MLNRALLLENIHPDATARLTKAGYEVRTMPRALAEEEPVSYTHLTLPTN